MPPAPSSATISSGPIFAPAERLTLPQGSLAKLVAFLDFRQRVSALVFVLDVGGNGPAVLFESQQHLFDRRVALAERQVRPVILLAVFDMQSHDALVHLLEVVDRVAAGGREVA